MVDLCRYGMGTPKSQPNTDPSKPLNNLRAEAFCLALAKGGVANAAYVEAYPAARKWKPTTVRSEASRLAALPQVQARLEWLRKQAASSAVADLQEVLEYYTKILRACPSRLLNNDGSVDILALKAAGQELESITIEDGRDGRKIKFTLRDGIAAARELARLQGWEKAQKVEHSGVVEVVRHDDGRG